MVAISHLSNKRRKLIKEILEDWETAELTDIREFQDNYIHLVFRLPKDDDSLEFIGMCVEKLDKYYKRISDRSKIDIRLTA